MKVKKWCCYDCGGHNIEWKVWVDEFGKMTDEDYGEDVWCNDCKEDSSPIEKRELIKEMDEQDKLIAPEITKLLKNNSQRIV